MKLLEEIKQLRSGDLGVHLFSLSVTNEVLKDKFSTKTYMVAWGNKPHLEALRAEIIDYLENLSEVEKILYNV